VLGKISSRLLVLTKMQRFTPHAWLAGNMVLFGFATIMQGLVKSYSGLLATRFFLGVFGTFSHVLEGSILSILSL
jgi:hypothetical protein